MTKKTELSKTIHLLGEILGNVIKEQEGRHVFNKIEKIRDFYGKCVIFIYFQIIINRHIYILSIYSIIKTIKKLFAFI